MPKGLLWVQGVSNPVPKEAQDRPIKDDAPDREGHRHKDGGDGVRENMGHKDSQISRPEGSAQRGDSPPSLAEASVRRLKFSRQR
jgi:hypothetical protein